MGTYEVLWKYDSISTGPFNLRDLVGEAVDGCQGWNSIHSGIKFVEDPNATYTWKWGDLEYPTLWAKTEITPLVINADTVGIDSIKTILNRNIQARDGTPLSWYNKNTAPAPITDTEVDAYSVIMHEWGHWYKLLHSQYNCAVMCPTYYLGTVHDTLKIDDIRGARWMYSDTCNMHNMWDPTYGYAPNYNGFCSTNPGGDTICAANYGPCDSYYEKFGKEKWDYALKEIGELWKLGKALRDKALPGSIIELAFKHKWQLLFWAVARPDLFSEAVNLILKYRESLTPAVNGTPLEKTGKIVTQEDIEEFVNFLEKN